MIRASASTREKIKRIYELRPTPMEPSRVPYTTSIKPKRSEKTTCLVAQVLHQVRFEALEKPFMYFLPIRNEVEKTVVNLKRQLRSAQKENLDVRSIKQMFGAGIWAETNGQFMVNRVERLSLKNSFLSSLNTISVRDPCLQIRTDESGALQCSVEATFENRTRQRVRTAEWMPFEAAEVHASHIPEK